MLALPTTIFLVDREAALIAAWREAFHDVDGVVVERRDYFATPADAMVAPGNSFAIMDGGLDRTIAETVGHGLAGRVRAIVEARHHGEIHVGCAELVETDDERFPWLVYAPTVRVPDDVSRTTNAFVAFRAILLAVARHNAEHADHPIRTLLCPGLCTGVGAMPPRRAAAQMRIALRQLREPPRQRSFAAILDVHRTMRTVD